MAQPGDVSIDTFSVGAMDLTNPNDAIPNFINIYEDITLPVFLADVQVMDITDSIGRNMLSGKEAVHIAFSVPGFGNLDLPFALMNCKDFDDKTLDQSGSMKYKTYSLRMVSQDLLTYQSTKLSKSFNTQTSDIVSQALQTITTANVSTPDPTSAPMRIVSNSEYVYDFINNLKDKHVSQQYQSSLYTLFANRLGGNETRTFCTFEYLMSQSSSGNYYQDLTVGQSITNRGMNNLLWLKIPDTFNTPIVWNSPSIKQVYNPLTGTSSNNVIQATSNPGVILGSSITAGLLQTINNTQTPQMRGNIVDPSNDKVATGIADAKIKRADYIKELMQNSIQFEINGDPRVTVGQVKYLYVPKKAFASQSLGENLINGPVLITKIRHKIGPVGTSPRYTMVIEAIKAAYAQGGA